MLFRDDLSKTVVLIEDCQRHFKCAVGMLLMIGISPVDDMERNETQWVLNREKLSAMFVNTRRHDHTLILVRMF